MDCASHHSGSVNVTRADATVEGNCSDGSDRHVYTGSFRGRLHDGKLYAHFCADDDMPSRSSCPTYDDREDHYFVT